MSLITFKDRLDELERDREEIAATLQSIREELRDLRERIDAGELGDRADGAKLLADVRYWLRAARETESEIKDVRKREAGIAYDYAIDLDEARAEVRCRLNRLRKCRKA